MPNVYFGDRALVSLTSATAVHELPFGQRIVSGVTPPAAAAGPKTFASKARLRMEAVATLGKVLPLTNFAAMRITVKKAELSTGRNPLDGALYVRVTAPRCILKTNASTPAVWFDGKLRDKVSLTGTLFTGIPKLLDGMLPMRVTTTCDLDRRAGTFIGAALGMRVTLLGTLTTSGAFGFDGVLRMRMVGNVAVLTIGTTHKPSGLLPVRWGSNVTLTTNYMQAKLVIPWRASCVLDVNVKLGAVLLLHQSAVVALARGPGTGGGFAGVHWSASARLALPLRAAAFLRQSASMTLGIQRRLGGSAADHVSATAALFVVRNLQALLRARQTAQATLAYARTLALRGGLRMSASAGLSVGHSLGGFAPVRWQARLALLRRPHTPPWNTEITVSPYTPVIDNEPLPVQVESPSGTIDVEEP